MPDKICFVYRWASAGGVERVFLNRSEALLRRYSRLEIDFYFYADCGGIALFERYFKVRNLRDRLRVARTFEPSRYDAVFVIDTPQFLAEYPSIRDKVFVECHTAYPANRTYLREWGGDLRTLLVPSAVFLRVLEAECPALRGRIKVLRNFVPHTPQPDPALSLPVWNAPLFLYFGRIDELKNVEEFVAALSRVAPHFGKQPLGIICGQVAPGYRCMEMIGRSEARGSIVVLPPIPFDQGHVLMRMLRRRNAVSVSCSKDESFGLSVAEAMAVGLPVVLSDIPAHSALVAHRQRFLYKLGRVKELAMKMVAAAEHYDECASECLELSSAFSEEAFLADWEQLFEGAANPVPDAR